MLHKTWRTKDVSFGRVSILLLPVGYWATDEHLPHQISPKILHVRSSLHGWWTRNFSSFNSWLICFISEDPSNRRHLADRPNRTDDATTIREDVNVARYHPISWDQFTVRWSAVVLTLLQRRMTTRISSEIESEFMEGPVCQSAVSQLILSLDRRRFTRGSCRNG